MRQVDIESALNLISKESSSIINLEEELLLYDGLENEVIESKNDLINCLKLKKHKLDFGKYINSDENIFLMLMIKAPNQSTQTLLDYIQV